MPGSPPRRIRIWHKLAAICVAFTIPLALTTHFLIGEKSIKINFARRELDGDRYLRVVSHLLRDVSRHRTVDRRQISGATGLETELTALRARIEVGFRDLEDVDRELRGTLATSRSELQARGREAAVPANLAGTWARVTAVQRSLLTSERLHAELISGMRLLITHLGDTSGLILDPDLDTYYTMDAFLIREPELFDQLGRVSDLIDATQERVNVSLGDRARLAGALSILQLHADQLEANLRIAFAATADFNRNDDLEPALAARMDRATGSVRAVADLATRQVVQASTPPDSTDAIVVQLREALGTNSELWDELFDQQDLMLNARKSADERRRAVALSSVGFVFVLIIGLTAAIARRISRNVGAVAEASQALAAGDLGRRAEVRSGDEIGSLAEAFNTMAARLEEAYASSEEKVRIRTLELQQNTASLRLLQRVAVAANEASSQKDATATVLRLVCEFADFPVGHAFFAGGPTGATRLVSSGIWHCSDPERLAPFRQRSESIVFEPGVGLPGRVLDTGEPAWISDVGVDANFPRSATASDAGIKAAMAFPVLVGKEVVAVLEFFSPETADPSSALLDLMVNVGTQLGRVMERWRAQAALREAKEAAESASQTKSAFLASMSHELRTPLNAIIGYSEMIEEDLALLGQQGLVADQERIRQSGRHLLGVIDDILDLSKIEAGRMDLFLETFDVAEMLEEVAATIRPVVLENGNSLTVEAASDLGLMRADLTKVRQALLNLLSNAAKFTENGTITLRARRSATAGVPWLSFVVTDSGIGMTQEQMDRLFQPFSQADSSTTRRYGGTGLGLFISRHYCRMMGGDLDCTSTVDVGSTFEIGLPAGTGDTPLPAGEDGVAGARARTVLVVDEDAGARQLVQGFLSDEGYRVLTAGDGNEALRLAGERGPDAILLDVASPDMDGWAVLSALKSDARLSEIPVVTLATADDGSTGGPLGAADYLIKPVDRDRLGAVLRELCATNCPGRAGTRPRSPW